MTSVRVLRFIDLIGYAIVMTIAVSVVTASVVYALSGRLTGVKWVLFILGSFGVAAGAWKMRPQPAWKDDPKLSVADTRGEGAFQAVVDRLLPTPIQPQDQFSDGLKLLVGSVCMLIASFLLEAVFGVPG